MDGAGVNRASPPGRPNGTSGPGTDRAKTAADARAHSRAKEFWQACSIYRDLLKQGALRPSDHLGFGWDLYYWTKNLLSSAKGPSPADFQQARSNLNIYMKLAVERPSVLHSCMLTMACKLASDDHLKMSVFLDLWGVENLRDDDYQRYTNEEGKTFPALAEKAVQRAAKEVAASGDLPAMQALLPRLRTMMDRYPDNPWFRQNLVKLLAGLGRHQEAREQAVLFAREKSREFWAWDLLGDLQDDPELRLACYCKGLLCPADDGFTGRLRLKLARALAAQGYASEARGEVEAVVAHHQRVGYKPSEDAVKLSREPWYLAAKGTPPDKRFYNRFAGRATELLYPDVGWTDACVGDSFTLEGEDQKPRRRIYVAGKPHALEFAVPERMLGLKNLHQGQPIRVKVNLGDDPTQRIKLLAAEPRPGGADFDVLPELVGMIDHVNSAKGVIHVIAGQDLDAVIPTTRLAGKIGDCVAIRFATFHSRSGPQTRIVTAVPTDASANEAVCRPFDATVRVSNGMGFLDGGVFVPPDIVREHQIENNDRLAGRAIVSFDRKKGTWGWRALSVKRVAAEPTR